MDSSNVISNVPLEETVQEPVMTKRICGFWIRGLALFIDSLMIGFVGYVIGFIFFDCLAGLGAGARLVGFLICLTYFGICNSSLARGQTLGKMITKIRVVNRNGETISLPLSLLRFTVLGAPFFLNNLLLPPDSANSFIYFLLGVIIFGGGGSIIYLYIFNTSTRQSFHDLIAGTYVVHSPDSGSVEPRPFWNGHYIVIAVIFLITFIVPILLIESFLKNEPLVSLIPLQKKIVETGDFYSASVNAGEMQALSWKSSQNQPPALKMKYLNVVAYINKRPNDYKAKVLEVAYTVKNSYPYFSEQNSVCITVAYGYDMGISRIFRSYSGRYSPSQWMNMLRGGNGSP